MSDEEHVKAIRVAQEALMGAVAAAREDGLFIEATLVERYPHTLNWALSMRIVRTKFLAESDGMRWVEVGSP